MAKRFTDTEKYKKPFFRGLPGAYKLLWDYLYHNCDSAGIWIVDFEVAQVYLGKDMAINKKDALRLFNAGENRVVEFSGGAKWFIPSFIPFQYAELSNHNPAHKKIIPILKSLGFIDDSLVLQRGFGVAIQATQVKEEEEVKEKVEEKEGAAIEIIFHFNQLNGTNLRSDTKATIRHIRARIKEGYTIQELKEIIELKTAQWKGDAKMERYLTPDTLFNSEKCGKYRNEVQAAKDKGLTVNQIKGKKVTNDGLAAEVEARYRERAERERSDNIRTAHS